MLLINQILLLNDTVYDKYYRLDFSVKVAGFSRLLKASAYRGKGNRVLTVVSRGNELAC